MNCPHCNIPLMGGMTVCPKCKYDTRTVDGGALHVQWLVDHKEAISEQLKKTYPQIVYGTTKTREQIMEEIAQAARYEKKRAAALPSILISSGFSFEGYKIVKYSGYISGDDVAFINRDDLFDSNGKNITDSLAMIRIQALKELKEAAYDLGCNAVIGVDFDYITLDPKTVNNTGGLIYQPYAVCVTANGNAVVIEKE